MATVSELCVTTLPVQQRFTADGNSFNNAHENAWIQAYMLGANWRAPRRFKGYARCVRWVE
ncbi:hypothetical protein L4D76_12540 [Photobacterium sagamiensis]|uniref:hypothetical protein n=1 Tax=Photobacterium sagamiensis TaxID=2910241 RepID=UPI003D0F18D6